MADLPIRMMRAILRVWGVPGRKVPYSRVSCMEKLRSLYPTVDPEISLDEWLCRGEEEMATEGTVPEWAIQWMQRMEERQEEKRREEERRSEKERRREEERWEREAQKEV